MKIEASISFPTNCVSLSELNQHLAAIKSQLVVDKNYVVTISGVRTIVRWDGTKLFYY